MPDHISPASLWTSVIIMLVILKHKSSKPHYFQVEVKAIPIDKKELGDCDHSRKMRRVSQPDPLSFGGYPPPPLHHPYEPTTREKMCFHAITVMKVSQFKVIYLAIF